MVDLGWTQGPFNLIARLLDFPPDREYYLADWGRQLRLASILSRGNGTSDVPSIDSLFATTTNFPFGADVERDHPGL